MRKKYRLLLVSLAQILLMWSLGYVLFKSDEAESSPKCQSQILTPYRPHYASDFRKRIFFLETSGSAVLKSRQACTIESAARTSDLDEIVVLFNSEFVNLNHEITCKIATEFNHVVKFHRIDVEHVLKSEMFVEAFGKNPKFPKSVVKLSDFLRLVYVFRYGGWYADLDFVFRKSLINEAEAVKWEANVVTAVYITTHFRIRLSNCIFRFEAGNDVLKRYIKKVLDLMNDAEAKKSHRTTFGPPLLNWSFKEKCLNFKGDDGEEIFSRPLSCPRMSMVRPKTFVPIRFTKGHQPSWLSYSLEEPQKHWDEVNEDAFAVHFYGSQTRGLRITGDESRENYAYLGRRFCPTSLPFMLRSLSSI